MIILIIFILVVAIGYRLTRKRNPYIKYHKKKWENEKDYFEYIKWLDKMGGDLPLNEVKFKSDEEVLKEVNRNFEK